MEHHIEYTYAIFRNMEENKALEPIIKRGRPKKTEPRANKRGRPKGQAAAQREMQQLLYEHPKRNTVINHIVKAALDDEHKNQGAAWKILADRLMPVSGFEKLRGHNAISININTVEPKQTIIEAEHETIEGDANGA